MCYSGTELQTECFRTEPLRSAGALLQGTSPAANHIFWLKWLPKKRVAKSLIKASDDAHN